MHDPIEMGTGEMTDHDPMCQRYEADHWCECDLIARVRADERERAAVVHMAEMDNMGADLLAAVRDLEAMREQRDAARAEVERLQRLVAVLEKMLDTEAMVLADLRAKVSRLTGRRPGDGTVWRADVLALIEEVGHVHG